MLDLLFIIFKLAVIIGLAFGALWLLFTVVLPILGTVAAALMDLVSREKEPAPAPTPDPDPEAFAKLARAAMAFCTRPDVCVVTSIEVLPDGTVLHRNASDPYGREMYVETQRRIDKTLVKVICRYADGRQAAAASCETPVSQVHWDVYFGGLEDLRVHGAHLSYVDARGIRRVARLPNGRRHHA